MKCEFVLTNYRHRDGRPVSRCRREGCDQIAFQLPTLIKHAKCHAPQWSAGDAAAGVFAKFGVTSETWPIIKHEILVFLRLKKPTAPVTPCDCARRRKRWNWFSFAMPDWVYRLLVRLKIRSPAADRIAEGLRIGLIVRV